jgi:hypothetical protein
MAEEEKKELHPVKALVEGIISLVFAIECIALPIVEAVLGGSYKTVINNNPTCTSETNPTSHPCTADELQGLKIGFMAGLIACAVCGLIVLVVALILGLKAAKYGKEAASEGGKAKVGRILGTVGWIMSVVLLVAVVGCGILGLVLLLG